jgi:hypothetical protein
MTTILHRLAASKVWGYIASFVAGMAALCLLDDDSLNKLMSQAWAERLCAGAAVVSFLIAWFSKPPASRRTGAVDKEGAPTVMLPSGQEIPNRRGVPAP